MLDEVRHIVAVGGRVAADDDEDVAQGRLPGGADAQSDAAARLAEAVGDETRDGAADNRHAHVQVAGELFVAGHEVAVAVVAGGDCLTEAAFDLGRKRCRDIPGDGERGGFDVAFRENHGGFCEKRKTTRKFYYPKQGAAREISLGNS